MSASPSTNELVSKLSLPSIYFTYMVISSIGSVVGKATFSTVALIFDIFPVIVFPMKLLI